MWILIVSVPDLCILFTFTEGNLVFETVQTDPYISLLLKELTFILFVYFIKELGI